MNNKWTFYSKLIYLTKEYYLKILYILGILEGSKTGGEIQKKPNYQKL